MTLTANATDTDGTITKVAFYNGGTKISEDTTSPFTATFTTTTTGTVYKFTAAATDDKGLSTTSTELGVTVGSVINAVPKVSLSGTPTSQTTPGRVTLTASPSDSDGTIDEGQLLREQPEVRRRPDAAVHDLVHDDHDRDDLQVLRDRHRRPRRDGDEPGRQHLGRHRHQQRAEGDARGRQTRRSRSRARRR